MLLLILLCTVTTLVSSQSLGDAVTVDLPFGSVKGYSNGESWQFYGIPFASAPIGELRWSPPTNFTAWNGTLDAKDPPPACIQRCTLGLTACAANMSEDCLYLNIFTPLSWTPGSESSNDVLLYIYGGSFVQGTSGCLLYDSRFFSKYTDSIIVTFNYRVGVLGFLRIPEFDIYGNMGFRDQRMAMQWVRQYIRFFGGGGKITLFGESAGAFSVAAHVASPASQGLFDSVIIQSSPWTLSLRDIADANYLGEQFKEELDCFTKECLYTKTAEDILAAQFFAPKSLTLNFLRESASWSPIIDNVDLTKQPYRAFIDLAAGSSLPPAIIGATTAEGDIFARELEYESPIKGLDLYNYLLFSLFPEDYISVNQTYNDLLGIPDDYIDRLSVILGDYIFLCPAKKLVATISEGGQKDVWNYLWNRGYTYNATASDICYNKACHGTELDYVFGTVSLWGQQFSSNDMNLSIQVQTYWKNLASRENPNTLPNDSRQYPSWPRYATGTEPHMLFDDPIGTVAYEYSAVNCDLLDSIGYELEFLVANAHFTICSMWLLVTALFLTGVVTNFFN